MNGLFTILAIIFIVNAVTSGKKKKQKDGGQQTAAQPRPEPRAPKPEANQVRIPYTREEWNAYLNEMRGEAAVRRSAPAKPAAKHEMPAAKRAAQPRPQPVEPLEGFGEGSFSTQGESAEEHAEHRRRIAEEEQRHREAHEALRDLRRVRRDQLRSAVIMKEILDRPVALRPRRM